MSNPAKPRLNIVIVSTRPGRVGPKVANWFLQEAITHGQFDAQLVDLADFALPVYDEPNHPRAQKYVNEHTKRWSESVASGDAFIFVTPEYNYTAPPSLFNALQYLYNEWNYKPAGFVSYAFGSGGVRAVQEVKTLLTTLKMAPIPEQVMVQNFPSYIDEQGIFKPDELHTSSAQACLTELARWSGALATLRAPAK